MSPRSVSQQSNGEGTAPVAFWRNLTGSNTDRVAREHGALDQIRVAAEIFRHAVDDEVGAELEGLLEERRRERVVDDEQRAGLRAPRPRSRRCRTPAAADWSATRSRPASSSARAPPRARPASPMSIWRMTQPSGWKTLVEDPVGAAVDVERDDDLVARPEVGLQHRVLRRQPGREHRRSARTSFELGQHRLEPRARRVVRPRVVEAAIDTRLVLLVGGRLEDRRDQRTGLRLRRLSGVNRLGGELHGAAPYLIDMRQRVPEAWRWMNVRNRRVSGQAADDQRQRRVARGVERGALHEIAAGVGHAQAPRRSSDRESAWRRGVAVGIRGEVAGDVLDQLARVGAQRDREQHRGQIRAAAAERSDRAASADAEEAGHDRDARVRKRRQHAQRPDAAPRPSARREASLMDVERRGADAEALKMERTGARPIAARRWTREGPARSGFGSERDRARFAEQRVGRAVLAPRRSRPASSALSPSRRARGIRATASNDASSRSTEPPILTTPQMRSPCEALLVERREGRRRRKPVAASSA